MRTIAVIATICTVWTGYQDDPPRVFVFEGGIEKRTLHEAAVAKEISLDYDEDVRDGFSIDDVYRDSITHWTEVATEVDYTAEYGPPLTR